MRFYNERARIELLTARNSGICLGCNNGIREGYVYAQSVDRTVWFCSLRCAWANQFSNFWDDCGQM